MNQENESGTKQKMALTSDAILKFFLGSDDYIDTLIKCRGSEFEIVTTDFNLYEALGSLKPCDAFNPSKLVKFLEVVDIMPYRKVGGSEKPVLTHERAEFLREHALKGTKPNDSQKK